MLLLAVLTGDHINKGSFTRKWFGHFAGPKKSSRDNEVTILPRWP